MLKLATLGFVYSNRLPCFLRHLRQVGNFKRLQYAPLAQDNIKALQTQWFEKRTELSAEEWQEVRTALMKAQKNINPQNIDAIILGLLNEPQQLELAKNYVNRLVEQGIQPNAATLGRLLRIYNANYHFNSGQLRHNEEREILNICQKLQGNHDILDALSCEHLIHGLVTTSAWRKGLQLLDMIKLSSMPTVSAFCELTAKAFSVHEFDVGWKLLHEMMAAGKQPKCEVFISYLRSISTNLQTFQGNLERLFGFLEQNELLMTSRVVECLQEVCMNHADLTVKSTQLNESGKCLNCGEFMSHIAISDVEFDKLRDEFLQRVLVRQDVFQKSTPEEVAHFKGYVAKTAPYDCVIDGLNVAYSAGNKKHPQHLANLVAAVVKYFKQRRKHVLVLGRKHMNSWPKDAMKYVRSNSSIFLTNDLTHDDPFLLYATLMSGRNTDFFSRDLMRSHAFLLGPELKSIFRRWQQEHQYALVTQTQNGKIIVKQPIRYRICAHRAQKNWHLPYKSHYETNVADVFEVPDKWLCVKLPTSPAS